MSKNLQDYLDKFRESLPSEELVSEEEILRITSARPGLIKDSDPGKVRIWTLRRFAYIGPAVAASIIALFIILQPSDFEQGSYKEMPAVTSQDTVPSITHEEKLVAADDAIPEVEEKEESVFHLKDEASSEEKFAYSNTTGGGAGPAPQEPFRAEVDLEEYGANDESADFAPAMAMPKLDKRSMMSPSGYPQNKKRRGKGPSNDLPKMVMYTDLPAGFGCETIMNPNVFIFDQNMQANEISKSINGGALDEAHDIAGINMLELSEKELSGLDIHFRDSAYTFITERLYKNIPASIRPALAESGYDTNERKQILVKTLHRIDKTGRHEEFIPYDGWTSRDYSSLGPVSYSTQYKGGNVSVDHISSPILYNGSRKLKGHYKWIKRKFSFNGQNRKNVKYTFENNSESLYRKEFIPLILKFHTPAKDEDDNLVNSVIMWFVPTREFIEALPERYSRPMQEELHLLAVIEDGSVPMDEACKGMANECSFYDICRSNSDLVSDFNIFPNPAIDFIDCKFSLKKNGNIRISLHDIDGRFIKEFMGSSKKSTGRYNYRFGLKGVNPGLYLICVCGGAEGQAVRRLIVR